MKKNIPEGWDSGKKDTQNIKESVLQFQYHFNSIKKQSLNKKFYK